MSKGKKLPGYLQQRGKVLHVVFRCGGKQVWRSTGTGDPKQAERIARAIMTEHEQIAAGLKPAERDRAKARMTCADAMERGYAVVKDQIGASPLVYPGQGNSARGWGLLS